MFFITFSSWTVEWRVLHFLIKSAKQLPRYLKKNCMTVVKLVFKADYWSIDWLIDWLTDPLIDPLIDWLIIKKVVEYCSSSSVCLNEVKRKLTRFSWSLDKLCQHLWWHAILNQLHGDGELLLGQSNAEHVRQSFHHCKKKPLMTVRKISVRISIEEYECSNDSHSLFTLEFAISWGRPISLDLLPLMIFRAWSVCFAVAPFSWLDNDRGTAGLSGAMMNSKFLLRGKNWDCEFRGILSIRRVKMKRMIMGVLVGFPLINQSINHTDCLQAEIQWLARCASALSLCGAHFFAASFARFDGIKLQASTSILIIFDSSPFLRTVSICWTPQKNRRKQ